MKKITLEITFDDTNGYKGHGDDTAGLIKDAIEKELKFELEADGVVKPGWSVEIVDNNTTQSWIEKRIVQEKKKYDSSRTLEDKSSKGGKIKAFNETLEYLKKH